MSLLEVENLKKIYKTRFGGQEVEALRNVSFAVEEGEFVAIMGESGSGKTTLLNILAALDKATTGRVVLKGMDLDVTTWDLCSKNSIFWTPFPSKTILSFPWCLREMTTKACVTSLIQ